VNMTDSLEKFGHQFNVRVIKIVGRPEVHNIFGPLDDQGLRLDLKRLKGESNSAYKQRILDVFVSPASATYNGLINGITRELGLQQFEAIEIDTLRDVNDKFVAPAPRIKVDSTEVILYSKWLSDDDYVIDRTIPIFNTIDEGFSLENLVSAINDSAFFTAQILSNVSGTGRSLQLLLQDSTQIVPSELVPTASSFQLDNTNIMSGSAFFSETDVFITEVLLENQVSSALGNYFIERDTGRIKLRGLPSGGGTVRYTHMEFPFRLKASNVVLQRLFDDKIKQQLFEQVRLNTGEFVNGLPKPETVDIINELIAVKGVYWGR
jgi:hypothetical protein